MTDNPVVEMLWETKNPSEVLREWFGFAAPGEVTNWVGEVLATHYRIALEGCRRVVMSDGNALAWVTADDGDLIVKWSVVPDRFERLAAVSELTAWLAGCGHPVSAELTATNGQTYVEFDGVSLRVQRAMTGTHLDVNDSRCVGEAGAVLARLHSDLPAYPGASAFPGFNDPSMSMKALIEAWATSDVSHLPPECLATLQNLLGQVPDEPLDIHLVHGDYRAANVLVDEARIVAVLDLEEARFDHAVSELARSAVMLGTLFRHWGPVSPEVHATFLHGYESVRALSETEARWWRPLVLWWTLLMVPEGEHDPTGWAHAAQQLAATPA